MYEKPVVIRSFDTAEGVFMASGDAADARDGSCWTVSVTSNQDWNGSHHLFRVDATHSTSVQHISTAMEVTIHFSQNVTDAYSENDWTCIAAGDAVTVRRENHANAYNSGDHANFQIWVTTGEESTTKALAVTSIDTPICTKSVNVQGGGADGN